MNTKILLRLILLLAFLVALVSLGGICIPETYLRETPDWRAQSIAQDWFDLIVAVPLLIGSALLYGRESRTGFFFLLGGLIFLIYTLIIYVFDVPFNRLFLVYCFALGVGCYTLIYVLWQTDSGKVKSWFDVNRPVTGASIYLVFFAVLFYGLWLSQVIPATISGQPPAELLQIGLLTNPVHVLDLSFLLPGVLLTAWLLRRRNALGYLFAPAIMTFSIVMTLSIATLVLYEYRCGLTTDYTVAIAMGLFAVVSILVLRDFLKAIDGLNGVRGSSPR